MPSKSNFSAIVIVLATIAIVVALFFYLINMTGLEADRSLTELGVEPVKLEIMGATVGKPLSEEFVKNTFCAAGGSNAIYVKQEEGMTVRFNLKSEVLQYVTIEFEKDQFDQVVKYFSDKLGAPHQQSELKGARWLTTDGFFWLKNSSGGNSPLSQED